MLGLPVSTFLADSYNLLKQPATILQIPKDIVKNTTQNTKSTNIPRQKLLINNYHIFQTFNNCGPAALSMALSYFNVYVSQEDLGRQLRPFQNAQGDNDDKSTTLEELAAKANEYGFTAFHRPNGNMEIIRQFIAADMPVIAKTWTKPDEDIGHYRVIKGYDDTTSQIVQDDSLQGRNLRFKYSEFNVLWEKFNYEYLVLIPPDKVELAEDILGDEIDPQISWQKAATAAQARLQNNPNDTAARFNLSIAYFNLGDYQNAVYEFEKIENALPFRTLWYQLEPVLSYYELGNYEKVFTITDKIISSGNRAYSEAYLVRGNIYLRQGKTAAARSEFEKAVFYNTNLKAARNALDSLP